MNFIINRWGSTTSIGNPVQILHEVQTLITNQAHIQAQYGSLYNPTTMLGAAYIGDGVDTCQGDSGGPLSVDKNDSPNMNNLEVVGISSWGFGCGNTGIYTRVSTYYRWIQQQNREFLKTIHKL